MQIAIDVQQTQIDTETITQMERRLRFALGRFDNAINRVSVRLTDTNGPKGGVDKECLVVVKLQRGGEVVVQGTGVDFGMILNNCANRISRAVDRELVKRRRVPIRKMRRMQNAGKDDALDERQND